MSFIEFAQQARTLGFTQVGVAPPDPYPGGRAFETWLEAGHHAGMRWIERDPSRRMDPAKVLEGVQSVIMLAFPYAQHPEAPRDGRARGRVARYALGRDYHKVLLAKLEQLAGWLADPAARLYVDTGPVLERSAAERAGLGWIGKNGCLIHPRSGSWTLLAAILTRRAFAAEPAAHPARCGTCTACMTACPTGAIVAPGVVDARRCLSYWTIEHRGAIPPEIRPLMGDWVFGCDRCQEVCPWNARAPLTTEPQFAARAATVFPDLLDVLALDEAEFLARYAGTPVMRAKREGLARNAAVALGNRGELDAVAPLERALVEDPSPVVRAAAAWALGRLGGFEARSALARARAREAEEMVRLEIEQALG